MVLIRMGLTQNLELGGEILYGGNGIYEDSGEWGFNTNIDGEAGIVSHFGGERSSINWTQEHEDILSKATLAWFF